ncbi:MAG: YggS family pyridoxal phosphate-dependent enzyme [Verrucomicrobia bacterium]|nr:YggS family pyridoxal phosphate-dependent enzyme [Verrucomicrobiota bacterium]
MLSERLKKIKDQIAEACHRSNRDHSEITLIAVTKYATLEAIREAYNLGLRSFGESRISTALEKMAQLPSDIDWHFIGHLQSNKVAKATGRFALVHSVDSLELAKKISAASTQQGCNTAVLLQVNTSGEPSKQGFTPDTCRDHFLELSQLPGITLQGLMTMAPLTEDASVIRSCFSRLRDLRDEFELRHLSMGMSHDFSIAIEEGATLLRIGSSLFGA